MNQKSRLRNSITNLASGLLARVIALLSGFVVRTVFVIYLADVYLSVNGLYSNIFLILSLADLGFGTAIIYSMYRPLAAGDSEKLSQLMQLYKKAFRFFGFVILALGLCLLPFLSYLIKDPPDIPYLTFYYLLFLLNTVLSYWFFGYKQSIISADQKQYIVTNYQNLFTLIKSIAQILILVIFHDFTLFLLVQLACTIGQNIVTARKADKLYPFINKKPERKLPKSEFKKIITDVKALMLTKIGHVILFGTDNLIISSFIGVLYVGYLSNYTMISEAITGILSQVTASMMGSLGNFFVTEKKEDGYRLFRRLEFMNFWLYGCCAVAMVTLLNPFVTLWLGGHYAMEWPIIVALGINFFVAGFMNTLWIFRSTLGLFTQGKYRPLIVAAVNIGLSILLGIKWGVFGVLFATFLARLSVNLWYDPWLIHRKGFNKSPASFFGRYTIRIGLMVIMVIALNELKNILMPTGVTVLSFIALAVVAAILPSLIFYLLYRKTDEFRYFADLVKTRIIKPIMIRVKPR